MSRPIIEVENLGKRYLIRHERHSGGHRYRRLSEELWEALSRPFRRRDEAGEPPAVEEFWALRNVSFAVREGEVLGVIGRNGAGKSTLLKILSRITEPSEGRVVLRGRVASLLEVGTGFHPELTGRENIYLNGAILGMSRAEIDRKFDEIVAFAGVEKFLDTPVKRYSSGMYVRLAFAVAAHLDPEILLVDEVLAVGDAEFQKRCLGKMGEVAKSGRTVLFVSHNMAAVQALTRRCLVLRAGELSHVGPTADAIDAYHATLSPQPSGVSRHRHRGRHTRISSCELIDAQGRATQTYSAGTPLRLRIGLETDGKPGMSLDVFVKTRSGSFIGMYSSGHYDQHYLPSAPGRYRIEIALDALWLATGSYSIDVATAFPMVAWDTYIEDLVVFDVDVCQPGRGTYNFHGHYGFGSLALPSKEFAVHSVSADEATPALAP